MSRHRLDREAIDTGTWFDLAAAEKRRVLGDVLQVVVGASAGIARRERHGRPFIGIDLFAGHGRYKVDNRIYDGSSVLLQDALRRWNLPHRTLHFEQSTAAAAHLDAELARPPAGQLFDPVPPSYRVINGDCCALLAPELDRIGVFENGILIHDPFHGTIAVDTIRQALERCHRLDVVIHVDATNQYKRPAGAGYHDRTLLGDVAQLGKRHLLVSEMAAGTQWAWLVATNWDGFPELPGARLHNIRSFAGRHLVDRLNLTRPQWRAKYNPALPFAMDGVA